MTLTGKWEMVGAGGAGREGERKKEKGRGKKKDRKKTNLDRVDFAKTTLKN